MKCPECGAWSTVLETRTTPERYRRRRECANEHKFTTEEIVVPEEKLEEEARARFESHRKRHVESFRKGRPKNIGNASQKA
jgi:transcriptional regulator NrdR family protein